MSTATMMPSPIPDGPHKRRRSLTRSRSRSPHQSQRNGSPPRTKPRVELPRVADSDPQRKAERERQLALRLAEKELNPDASVVKSGFDAQAEFEKLLGSSRAGGVYIPPGRLRAMQAAEAAKDKSSAEYQRISWDALRKSITGIVNRVNVANIKHVVPELFAENLVRGRGLFCRSIMKAQASSLPFTPVFACLVAIVNTKLPQVGELLLIRLLSQFRRAYKRNDKIVCISSSLFLAHLVNQEVAPDIVAIQLLLLLLEKASDDSVEIAVSFTREVGAYLSENATKMNNAIFERYRAVLNEATISQRVQYMIEVLFQVRKDKYKDNPIKPEGLDLVLDEEAITHEVSLDGDLAVQESLNVFKYDPKFLENEEKYRQIKSEILGDSDDDESGSEEGSDEEEEEEEVEAKEGIEDLTGTNLVNLRRIIYLTIMNALGYEEAVHKLLKVQLDEGQEIELCNMVIECCSQERSYSKFYGLIGERLCKLNRVWCECFQEAFGNYYETIHRYETNRLRNIAKFFGHLLATDAFSWVVLGSVKMNEDETTSSSRIFVKILLQEVMEATGLKTMVARFADEEVKSICRGMFPMDNPKNTRFAINYFTSIGLGAVTEGMREHLKNAPRLIMEQHRALLEDTSSSDSDSSSESDSSSDDSSSGSEESERRSRSRSPQRLRRRTPSLSESRSRSPPPSRRRERSPPPPAPSSRRSPPPSYRRRDRDGDVSMSPPPRRGRSEEDDKRRAYSRNGDRRYRDASRASPPPPPSSRRDIRDDHRHRSRRTPSRDGGYRNRDRDREDSRDRGRDLEKERGRDSYRGRRRSPSRSPSRDSR